MTHTTFKALLLGLLSLSLAACSPGTAIGQIRQITSNIPGAFNGATTGAGSAASGPDQSAIQLVIQRGDLEQEQAIASKDSSVMKDTSTSTYYQSADQQNQDLIAAGATAIKLVNIEWGQVSVNGNNATANDFETWSTTYSDGSTDQSRDQNVYTLVKQNGSWLIQADDQPNSSAAPSPSAQPRPSARPSGRPSTVASPAPSGASAQPAPSGSPLAITAQTGTPEAAIEQVILKGNTEQEQAISGKDSTVMKDTSTDTYYQDLAQSNQDMLDSGVTAIKLVSIQWGPVSVTGTNATATSFETWSTNYSDGSTDQSRDQNVYTLVQQSGAWKIQADDHPSDRLVPGGGQPGASTAPATSPAASGTSASGAPPAPALPRGRGQSSNWSGYSASGGSFTAVNGTWTVPQISASSGAIGADAAWVGIGGERSRDLIQAGTEETVLSSGKVQYDAWIETLPQYSHPIPLTVHGGDSVTVALTQGQPGSWQIAFKNNTTGESYDRTVPYQSSLSSAEWIEEAPSGGRGGVMPIDNFGAVAFSGASTVKDGKTVNLTDAGAQPITMINGGNQPLATPSSVSSDGAGFTVTRTSNPSGGSRRGAPAPRPSAG